MKNIILFNLKIVFDKNSNKYIYGIFSLLLIITISILNVKIDRNHITSSEHLFFLERQIHLIFFIFFSNILFPIIFFSFLIPLSHISIRHSVLPISKLEMYKSWLAIIWLFLVYLGVIFISIVLIRMVMQSNPGLIFSNFIHLVFWVLGILFFTFFSFQVYLLFFYLFKSKYPILILLIASIFLIRLEYFFWLPMNWPYIFVDAVFNNLSKLNFFHEHSINSLIFLFVVVVLAVNVAIKKMLNE